MILTIEEVLKATGGKLLQGKGNAFFQGISTDSRTVAEGELFIALKGSQFDGHHYALEALEKKAGGVLIEEDKVGDIRWNGYRSRAVITVKDTLSALGDMARDWRRKYGTPVVALTGSNGKTTTKEMVAACLETTFPILKTKGNLNNLIGVPLTLLTLTEKERVAVLEMGMNVPGEIRRLTEMAEPDVGLITNIQKVHLEGMGRPMVGGIIFWEWTIGPGGPGDEGYTPKGKPAEQILRDYFKRHGCPTTQPTAQMRQ